MAIRLTPQAKEYLERVLLRELKYIRLSMVLSSVKGEMSYAVSWTDKIVPEDLGKTARDWNVIVIERKYAHLFEGALLDLDPNDPTKVIILENPNVLLLENGKVVAIGE